MNTLADRYHHLKSTLPQHVRLIAVSKTRSVEEIKALYDLGHRAFGENYPQELKEKQPQLPADIEWHFIGHLQTNKVKLIAPFVHLVHSADSERLLDELDKRASSLGRTISVLVQVHVAQEETKHGFAPDELRRAARRWQGCWPNLRVQGLMAMATMTEDRSKIDAEFAVASELFEELKAMAVFPPEHLTHLSMGMSGDMDLAIAHGSTMVRVGTALFGPRQ
ncbi:MAG: YggS family pyridoxal phosphate-dependent enzyme [Flavobacteriales bacterium]